MRSTAPALVALAEKTRERIARAVAMLEAGCSRQETAEALGLSQTRNLARMFKRQGVALPQPKKPGEDVKPMPVDPPPFLATTAACKTIAQLKAELASEPLPESTLRRLQQLSERELRLVEPHILEKARAAGVDLDTSRLVR